MSKVLIIGCGGVANVAIRKCCQCDDLFTDICIASRTKSKCDALKADLEGKTKTQMCIRDRSISVVKVSLFALETKMDAFRGQP